MDTGDLAIRVRAGDRAAFQELYDRVAPALYAWTCLRVQGGPAGVEPQDVLQEAWLRGLQGIERYDPACSFRGWMLAIIKNLLLQAYRRHSYDLQRGIGSLPERRPDVLDCPDSVTSISVRLGKDESIQRLLAYVGGLPLEDRLLVLYCGFEDQTCAEAGTRLGLSPDAANKRWLALRARMRENGALRILAVGA